MTDPISHALALAHAARRGRDDGGPVSDDMPQGDGGINEFAGAIVPEAEIDRLSPILQRNKINRVETYPAGDQREEARRALLKKFMDHSFETGGAVETAKAILTSA